MKRLYFLSGVCLGGGVDAFPGEIHPVDDQLAASLLHRGKAVLESQAPAGQQPSGEKSLDDLRATELLTWATEHQIDLGGMKPQDGQAKILATLKAALAAKGQP